LVVLDRPLAIALVPERSADLAVQVPDPRQVLLAAVVVEALLPELDRAVDPPEPKRDVAELLGDSRAGRGVEPAADRERHLVVAEGLEVRVQRGGDGAGGLERVDRLPR